jgi:serum/glucocorticoid-regulated kinase 2
MGICCCLKSKNSEGISKTGLLPKEFQGDTTLLDKSTLGNMKNLSPHYLEKDDHGNIIDTKNCPKTNDKISKDDFERIKLLGRGTFGEVFLVRKFSSNKLYAMKILKKDLVKMKNQVDHTKTERKILEKIENPFIVSLFYAFQDYKKLYLVTEFMQGGELFYHLRKEGIFKESRAKFYLCEIVLALEHLHSNGCIYRDLKPENILIDVDGHIKLTDFGLSKIVLSKKDDERAFTICGTPEYLAPEVIMDKGYDKTVDWWSLGALFYEMLCGFSPFKTNQRDKLDIKLYTKPVTMHAFFSEDIKSLISQLLKVNPKDRLGYGKKGSQNVKNHPYFKNIDWEMVASKKISVPFIPKIIENNDNKKGDQYIPDLSNFDPMFTKENVFEPQSEMKEKDYLISGEDKHNSDNLNGEDPFTNSSTENNKSNKVFSTGSNYDGFTYIKNSTLSLQDKE